jgi:peptidoglycan/xylan/chitin deacetylase (PgdA/CDA1 family)
MIAQVSNRILRTACRVPGALRLARRLRAGAVGIVMYHGVNAAAMRVPNWCQLDATEFQRQVAFLAREYRVLPLGEVVERLWGGQPLPERAVCLTFDDGFRNVLTTALPILMRHQVPATVFLVTGAVGTRQPAWPDLLSHDIAATPCGSIAFEDLRLPLVTPRQRFQAAAALGRRLKAMEDPERERRLVELRAALGPSTVEPDEPQATLDWDEIRQLARTGLIDFGSHTHTHPILSRCSPDRQRAELQVSRDILLDRLGTADLFAYPNGGRDDFNGQTQAILRELGYRCAVSTISGLNRPGEDLFALKRVPVGFDTVGQQFQLGMAGL